jgi:threonine dehydrogenase-like Zn-dependent dehydrogenase
MPASCVCGSDLWSYRGISPVTQPTPFGHEYCGIVEEVGSDVRSIRPGQFVIGSFFASDNTCPHCQAGFQSSCQHREIIQGAQAQWLRVPLADGTLVPTPGQPDDDLIPSLLTLSDVMGTGWFAAVAANVRPGMTVAVVGDGAVGLLGVLSAARMGAERIIAMSRHAPRQKLAVEFGATDLVTERGDDGVARIKDMTDGVGADAVLECVGTAESMTQAMRSTRPGGFVGFVGVPHGVNIPGEELFFSHVGLRGGPAPVRRFLPDLIELVCNHEINPGKVFDLTLPLHQGAEGYRAMDERRAIKTLLRT